MNNEMYKFKQFWTECQRCAIGQMAKKHVLWKGKMDARILFIGEGPGRSEDVIGVPFVGRAGKLLDRALEVAGVPQGRCIYTNLVACRPCDQLGGPNRAPTEEEYENCKERLFDLLKLVRPKAVIWLGRVPQQYAEDFKGKVTGRFFFLPHPAFALRLGGESSDVFKMMVKRIKEVSSYVEDKESAA